MTISYKDISKTLSSSFDSDWFSYDLKLIIILMNKKFFSFAKGYIDRAKYPMYAYVLAINGGVYLAW